MPKNEILAQLLRSIAARHPEHAQLIDAFSPLLQVHSQLEKKWRAAGCAEQQPFSGDTVPMDEQMVHELVPLLLDAFATGFPALKEKVEQLRVCQSLEGNEAQRFLDLCAHFDPERAHLLAIALKADAELLHLLLVQVQHALAVRARLGIAEELLKKDILHGRCPACGSAPDLSILVGTEGKRMLHCSLCGYYWPYQRTACVACQSAEPKNLQLAYLEENDAEWAETCQSCKRYILGVDCRKLSAELEHAHALALGMTHLDMLMQQEGYVPLEN